MTVKEAGNVIEKYLRCRKEPCNDVLLCSECDLNTNEIEQDEAFIMAIEALNRSEIPNSCHDDKNINVPNTEQLPSAQPEKNDNDFEEKIHGMFDHIWECEIEHPIFQDTVGELMSAVIQLHNQSVQPEPCEDAVSRKDAIRWIKTECNPYGKPTLDFESGKKVIEHLERMSAVTPKRKKGKWIKHPEWQSDGECGYECDQCGMGSDVDYDFCMRCEADMREGKE